MKEGSTHRGNPQAVMKYQLPDASMSQKPHFFFALRHSIKTKALRSSELAAVAK